MTITTGFLGTGNKSLEVKSDQDWGQTFVMGASGSGSTAINSLSLGLFRMSDASPQTIKVTIRSSWDGSVLWSGQVSSSALSTSTSATYTFANISGLNLQQGTRYVLQITSSSTAGKVYLNSSEQASSYSTGTLMDKDGVSLNGDLRFNISGTAPAPVTNDPQLSPIRPHRGSPPPPPPGMVLSTPDTSNATPQNSAPVLTGAGSDASFREAAGLGSQAAGVAVFSGISLATGDGADQTILSFSLSVEGLLDGASELLLLDGSPISLGSTADVTTTSGTTAGGLSWILSVSGDTATLTVTSAAGLDTAAAAALLNGLAYLNISTDNPSAGTRRFCLTAVQDSGGSADGGVDTTNPNFSSSIQVVAVNDAPLLGSLTAIALVDSHGFDAFSAGGGTLAGTDPEGASLSTSSTPLLVTFSAADDTPVQYVVVNDGLPVLSAAAASLWDQALTQASAYLAELLTRADRDTLLNEVFGRAGTEATTFEANKQALLEAIGTTGLKIAIDLRSDTEMEGAIGAYAQVGPNGNEQIYINADWINAGNLSLEQLTAVVLEEYGHALDVRLNPGLESAGDEGELFANLLLGNELGAEERAAITAEDDSATLAIDGAQVSVEQAAIVITSTNTSTNLGLNYTTAQTISPTKAAAISVTVSVGNSNNNGADILIAAYQGTTLIGWSVYDRTTNLDGNGGSPNATVTFNLAQFNTSLTAGSTDSGLVIKAWQGTFNGSSITNVTTATASGTGTSVAFTPNTSTYTTNTTVSGTLTGGSTLRGWAVNASDLTRPTLAITSSTAALRSAQTATITFTFSEDPGSTFTWNGSTGDVVVTGGTLGAISGTGLTRTATFTPTASLASGSASITVAAGTYTDTAGNNGGAGTTPSISLDTLAPTLTAGAQSAQLVEAGSAGAGTDTASRTLSLSGGTYSTDYLTANGWTAVTPSPVTTADANGSGYSYEIKVAQVGSQSFTLTGSGSYIPTSLALALVRGSGMTSPTTYQVTVEIASQANTGGTVYFSWSGFANTFPIGDQSNASNRTSVELSRLNAAVLQTGQQYFIRVRSSGSGLLYWSGSSSALNGQLSGNVWETASSTTDKDLEYQLTYTSDSTSYTKTGTYGAATLNTSTGVVSYTLNNSDADTNALAASASASDSFTVRAVDPAGNATDTPVSFAITGSNDAPVVTSGATASFAENATGTVYTASATDPDTSTTLTYSIAGTDAALFNINSSTGAVTFKSAPNFEAPADAGANNVYDITVTASDGSLSSAAQAVAITVTNVNEAPSITSGATASFAENATGTVYTASATDPDTSTTLTYSIAGTDAALFNINSSTGAVTFKSAPNFEAPADAGANNVYDITVTASDGSLSSAAQNVAITVTDVDDTPPNAPVISTVTDNVSPVTGTVASGGSTNDTVLVLAGTAEANSTVTVRNGGTSLGTTSADVSGAWSFTTATLADGSYTFNATATDAAGNVSSASADYTVTVDTVAPTIAISSNVSTLKAGETATITFTLSEASTNFTADDVTATGGTLSNFSGSGTSYTATFTPTADSTTNGVISVASSTFSDAAGNNNSDGADANNTVTLTVDTIQPSIAISSNVSSLKAGETATITFTLSEASTNFAVGDVTVSGGTLSGFSGSGTAYTATFTPTANSTANGVISVASSTFSDAAGNTNNDGGDANNTVTLTVDTLAPTAAVAITSIADDTGISSSDFITSDTTLSVSGTNGTLGSGEKVQISSDGTSWFDVTQASGTWTYIDPTTRSSSFTYQVRVIDTAGNVGTTASQAITVDATAPVVTISAIVLSADTGSSSTDGITNTGSQTIKATLSAALAVASGSASAEQLWASANNGTTWTNISSSVSGTSVSWATTLSGSGTIVMQVRDSAGNAGTTSAGRTYTIDLTAPTTTATVTSVYEGTTGPLISNGGTAHGTTALRLNGTLSTTLANDESVRVFDGTTFIGTASVTAGSSSWSYTDGRNLPSGQTVNYTARVADTAGNQSASTTTYAITQTTATPIISANNVSVVERAAPTTTQALFAIFLSRASTETVSVKYQFQAGTATSGIDYTAAAGSQTLTFNPGITTLTIPYTIMGDGDVEADETLTLQLSNPNNATFSGGSITPITATGTIINDDSFVAPTGPNQGITHTSSGSFNGSEKNDMLTGDADGNSVNGLAGNDVIAGMGGADTLTGSTGADTFAYTSLSDSTLAAIDFITDFSVTLNDKIDLPFNQVGFFNRGVISASTLDAALRLAFDDKDLLTADNQPLQSNEIVIFQWGTSSLRRNTYIASPDGNGANFNGDLLIKLPNAPGTIIASTFI